MFVQVFQGQIQDRALWEGQVEIWKREIKPKTKGFLGFTTGITSGGYSLTIVRFRDEATARVDSDLPEQGAWFEQASKAFRDGVVFHDCAKVDQLFDGASDDAGFVQVTQGRAKDEARMRAEMKEIQGELHEVRPDLVGVITGWHGDGSFTEAAYFTSEHEARTNEKAMANNPVTDRFLSLVDGEPTFYDLISVGHD
jgi:hypothetical protein